MSSSNNAYWRHYTSAHCVEAGDVAWGDLARSSALNDLDTSAVAADAMRANAFALPVEIKSIIGAAHELADSPRRDHWGLRQLAAARLGGHLPEHLRPPESDWSLIGSSLTTQPLHRTLTGHTRSVYSVAFGITPTGQLLLATASYETIRIWAPTTGTPLDTLTGHTDWVRAVAFGATPTGQLLLATGSDDKTIRIWDPTFGIFPHTLTGHTDWVTSVAFGATPTGQLLLATGSSDETIRIWDPTTGTPLHTLTGHTDWVTSVAFGATPTGQLLLATASDDHTVRILSHLGLTMVKDSDPRTIPVGAQANSVAIAGGYLAIGLEDGFVVLTLPDPSSQA